MDNGGHCSQVGASLHDSGLGPYSVGWQVEALRQLPVSPRIGAWTHGILVPAACIPEGCLFLWAGMKGPRLCSGGPHSHSREERGRAQCSLCRGPSRRPPSQRGEVGLPYPKLGNHLGCLSTVGPASASGTRQALWPGSARSAGVGVGPGGPGRVGGVSVAGGLWLSPGLQSLSCCPCLLIFVS